MLVTRCPKRKIAGLATEIARILVQKEELASAATWMAVWAKAEIRRRLESFQIDGGNKTQIYRI